MEAFEGSYDALRATADQIATSTLRETLPEPWQELVANPITDGKKRPLSILPGFVDKNEAFTKVSFKDVHLEAKTFVRQYRFGTGSYQSTHDCVTSRLAYRRARHRRSAALHSAAAAGAAARIERARRRAHLGVGAGTREAFCRRASRMTWRARCDGILT